jgi:type VI secretion system protein VasG
MLCVDIKALLRRLNPYCTASLEAAAGLCVSRTHYEVTIEHVLIKLLENPQADLALILQSFELDTGNVLRAIEQGLEELQTGNAGKPVFSPLLMQWLQQAWLVASVDLEHDRVRSTALLLALLSQPLQLASGSYIDLLTAISRDALQRQFWDLVKNSIETADKASSEASRAAPPGQTTALDRFCEDFTAKAAVGDIDPVFGRDAEIRQMVDILARRRKNNPIVVGEAGVGKTAVVEGLALRVVQGDVPDMLKDVSIIGLDMGQLQAGAGMKGEFENRLKSVINEVKACAKPIILFIDEAHTLIGAGGSAGMSDAANLLKPALARGELRTVAATTWSEYKKYFEKDAALARRFQLVKLDEPSEETAKLILRGLKTKYEQAHHVAVRDDAVEAAAEMAGRYISGRQLPDKAVDLLDTAAARVKILLTAKPDVVEDKQRRIQALERELAALERDKWYGTAADAQRQSRLQEQLDQLGRQLEQATAKWQKEQACAQQVLAAREKLVNAKSGSPQADTRTMDALTKELAQAGRALAAVQQDAPLIKTEVDPDVVAKVVSDWTGIPLGRVMRDQAQNIIQLEEHLKQRIKGQDQAMAMIARGIKAAKSGLTEPNQPLGVFLLVGPSGVGKTETGLALADALFGGENFMVSVNMSEFQEKHTVSRLIGSPPGYVGYGEGGVLTEAVRRRPYSVVLLDEVEKGHLEVMNLFYQVFDKGMLSDGEGRDIDFKNTVIFLTSNLATNAISEMCSGNGRPDLESVGTAIRPLLSNHFKPALLARMTIVPYLTLPDGIMQDIARLKIDKLAHRLAATHNMQLTCTDAVVEQIAARCTEVETGARNIDYIMSGTIMPLMSQQILARMSQGGLASAARLDVGPDGAFSIEFGVLKGEQQ